MSNEEPVDSPVESKPDRVWIFKGVDNGIPFAFPVRGEDRESAIAEFESEYPEFNWAVTEEVTQ